MTDFTPTPEDRFSFGFWTVGWQGVDVFGGAVREPLDPTDQVGALHERHGVVGIEREVTAHAGGGVDDDVHVRRTDPFDGLAVQRHVA